MSLFCYNHFCIILCKY